MDRPNKRKREAKILSIQSLLSIFIVVVPPALNDLWHTPLQYKPRMTVVGVVTATIIVNYLGPHHTSFLIVLQLLSCEHDIFQAAQY